MKIAHLVSTNIKTVAHDGDTLYIEFQKGPVYIYADVSEEVFHGLVNASSAGQFFHQQIKGKYAATPIASLFAAEATEVAAA